MTKIRLLTVEDSGYMLMALRAMVKLDPRIEIVGEAQNGTDGIAMALDLAPDVITMDINMPGLNGIEATRQIMAQRPTPIITLSSMTERGKTATAQAFAAGAVDFIPKSMSAADIDLTTIARHVTEKIRFWGQHGAADTALVAPTMADGTDLVLCVGGTGCPLALASLLQTVPARVTAPILVSLASLSALLAEPFVDYLGRMTGRPARVATHRGALAPNTIAVVPGGRQARLEGGGPLTTLLSADPTTDIMASAVLAARQPCLIALSGEVRPLQGLVEVATTRPVTIAVQDPSTCVDSGLVDAIRRSSLASIVLTGPSETRRQVAA